MRTSRKDRRSERVPVTHRLLLTILGPSGAVILKEIVTTVEISQHGARLKGRRTLESNWKGVLVQLGSGQQSPCRVVWQTKSTSEPASLETGVEILASHNFWRRGFSNPDAEPEPAEIVIEDASVTPEVLLRKLAEASDSQAQGDMQVLEAVWCGLVEQLEERNIFTRAELIAAIRKIGLKRNP